MSDTLIILRLIAASRADPPPGKEKLRRLLTRASGPCWSSLRFVESVGGRQGQIRPRTWSIQFAKAPRNGSAFDDVAVAHLVGNSEPCRESPLLFVALVTDNRDVRSVHLVRVQATVDGPWLDLPWSAEMQIPVRSPRSADLRLELTGTLILDLDRTWFVPSS